MGCENSAAPCAAMAFDRFKPRMHRAHSKGFWGSGTHQMSVVFCQDGGPIPRLVAACPWLRWCHLPMHRGVANSWELVPQQIFCLYCLKLETRGLLGCCSILLRRVHACTQEVKLKKLMG